MDPVTSVKDEVPENGRIVLAWLPAEYAWWPAMFEDGQWYCANDPEFLCHFESPVTHWTTLPQPGPEE